MGYNRYYYHMPLETNDWAIPLLLDVKGYIDTDAFLMRFGILLWNWMPGSHVSPELEERGD